MITRKPAACPDCGETTLVLSIEKSPSVFYLEMVEKSCNCEEDPNYLSRAYARLCDDGGEVSNV